MPRMAKSEMEKFYDTIPAEIIKLCDINKIGIKEAVGKFGMKYGTYNNRHNNPSRFTLGELLSIASYFNVSLFTLLGKDIGQNERR